MIVPWPAGGASDTVARMISGLMEQSLGQRMVIVNTPGGAGAIGTKEVWDKPHDGYTLTGQRHRQLRQLRGAGQAGADAPGLDLLPADLHAERDLREGGFADQDRRRSDRGDEGQPRRGGPCDGGRRQLRLFRVESSRSAAGVTYRHVPYAGGVPAVMAVASGEAEIVTQLSVEVAELLRGGKLRALAVSTKVPLTIEGYGEIPSIRSSCPSSRLRLVFRSDGPRRPAQGRHCRLRRCLRKAARRRPSRTTPRPRARMPIAIYGKEAKDLAERLARKEAWILFDSGTAAKIARRPEDPRIPHGERHTERRRRSEPLFAGRAANRPRRDFLGALAAPRDQPPDSSFLLCACRSRIRPGNGTPRRTSSRWPWRSASAGQPVRRLPRPASRGGRTRADRPLRLAESAREWGMGRGSSRAPAIIGVYLLLLGQVSISPAGAGLDHGLRPRVSRGDPLAKACKPSADRGRFHRGVPVRHQQGLRHRLSVIGIEQCHGHLQHSVGMGRLLLDPVTIAVHLHRGTGRHPLRHDAGADDDDRAQPADRPHLFARPGQGHRGDPRPPTSARSRAAAVRRSSSTSPGTPAQAAVCLDGYPLAQQGKAAQAIGLSVTASTHRHPPRVHLPRPVHAADRHGWRCASAPRSSSGWPFSAS